MPNDKTLPILLHKTWPGVPRLSCLGLWTGDQEPRSTDSKAPTHFRLHCHLCTAGVGWFCSGCGPWLNGRGLRCPIATAKPKGAGLWTPDHGSRALEAGPL